MEVILLFFRPKVHEMLDVEHNLCEYSIKIQGNQNLGHLDVCFGFVCAGKAYKMI